MRWQRHEFLDVERLYARAWRRGLAAFDLTAMLANFGLSESARLQIDLSQAKQLTESLVRGERHRFSFLKGAMEMLGVPPSHKPEIIHRWKAAGGPPFYEFAPYAAYVLNVDLTRTWVWRPVIFHPGKTAGLTSPTSITCRSA